MSSRKILSERPVSIGWQWNKKTSRCVPVDCEAPEPDCNDWDDRQQCCHAKPGPSPTPKHPVHGGGYDTGKNDSYGSWRKRGPTTRSPKAPSQDGFRDDVDETLCPAPLKACAVTDQHSLSSFNLDYECIDIGTDVDSCGGCASEGTGVDCNSLPAVVSSRCDKGVCKGKYLCPGPSALFPELMYRHTSPSVFPRVHQYRKLLRQGMTALLWVRRSAEDSHSDFDYMDHITLPEKYPAHAYIIDNTL
ncbi:hypothetical protein NliqN6_5395 [Naganishia liquefaciens]|uniref:Protein CPL1-like domain-containing protein n=1 Tax=Naganishia liquefaciens TaxID=104408 RepID=A0A8H3TXP2_9TREE|nr:hypothetical protein NliqN6_5395 [Naganishia liquefaciens]